MSDIELQQPERAVHEAYQKMILYYPCYFSMKKFKRDNLIY